MTRVNILIIGTCALLFLSGCIQKQPQKTAAEHHEELGSTKEIKTTLGLFQMSVREGMPQSDVATAVGSPNIVTQDADGNDTWIYDKISTETSHSDSSQKNMESHGIGVSLGIIGAGITQSQSSSNSAGAASQSQKTLTVVIKFNKKRQVSKIRYQSSSF